MSMLEEISGLARSASLEKEVRMPEAAAIVYRALIWKNKLTNSERAYKAIDEKGHKRDKYRDILAFVTRSWLNDVISKKHGKQANVKEFTCDSIEGVGFLSCTFRINITYESDEGGMPSSLVLKVPGSFGGENFEVIAKQTNCYEREYQFYNDIAPLLEQVEHPHGMRIPILYHCELVGPAHVRLLMEDLGTVGVGGDQIKGMAMNRVKPLVLAAAVLHGTFWEGCGQHIPDHVVGGDGEFSMLLQMRDGFMATFSRLLKCKCLKAYNHGFEESFVSDVAHRLHENWSSVLHRLCNEMPQTLIHADYRADNVMLLHDSDNSVVLDWQLFCTGPGTYDLVNIIVNSMTPANRREHCMPLLHAYVDALQSQGIKYTFDSLWDDFRLCIIQHIFLILHVGIEGVEDDKTCKTDWNCLELCKVIFQRLMLALVDYKCLEVI